MAGSSFPKETAPDIAPLPDDIAPLPPELGDEAETAYEETTEQIDWVTLANGAFSESTSYLDSNYRSQWEQNYRQFRSMHPTGSKYTSADYIGKSRVYRPKTRSAVRKTEALVSGAFFSTDDVVSIASTDEGDEVQAAMADYWSAALNWRLQNDMPWFLTVAGAAQEAQVIGVVCSKQFYHPVHNIPYVDLIPPEQLRISPNAGWVDPINRSPYVIHLIPMFVHEIKTNMNAGKWHPVDDKALLTAANSMGDSTREVRDGQRATPTAVSSVTDYSLVWVREVIMKMNGQDWHFYMLADQTLLTEPEPLETVYLHGKRPFVMGVATVEAHRIYPSSTVELVMPIQAEINEVANQRMDNVRLAMNRRYTAKQGKQADIASLTRNVPNSVTMVNDHDDIRPLEVPDVTASSYKEQDLLNLDFDDLAGNFSGSSVQSNRNLNETVGGMQMLNSSASQLSEYTMKIFAETWVEPVLRQVLALMQHHEVDPKVLGRAQQAAQLDKYGITEMTDELLLMPVRLSVNVGMGASNPLTHLERFTGGLAALQRVFGDSAAQKLDFNEVAKEIFGKSGFKDGGRFLVAKDDEQDPQITALQEQIAQLQAELQQKKPPELLAAEVKLKEAQARVADANAFRVQTTGLYEATQGAQTIAAMPMVAPIADGIARSAGFIDRNAAPVFPQGLPEMPDVQDAAEVQPTHQPELLPPEPEGAGLGVRDGIETQRPDGVVPNEVGQ